MSIKFDNGNLMALVSSVFIGEEKRVPNELYSYQPKITQNLSITPLGVHHEMKIEKEKGVYCLSIQPSNYLGMEMICPFVSFKIPNIIRKNLNECVKYCSLPAIHLIKSVQIECSGKVIECLNGLTLEVAIKKLLQNSFEHYADKWLGGLNGKYQQFTSTQNFDDNELIPEILCIVPLPFSIFRNEKLFPLPLADILNIQINFKTISSVISHSEQNTYENKITDIYFCAAMAKTDTTIFNQLPCVNPNKVSNFYLLPDKKMNYSDCKLEMDRSIDFSKDLITEYMVCIYNRFFHSKQTFLGKNNEDCRANWWASLFCFSKNGSPESSLIHLKSKSFVSVQENLKSIRIEPTQNTKLLLLKTPEKNDLTYTTIISSDIDFSIFPNELYLNINTWHKTSHCLLKPDFFRTVHFKIVPFDAYATSYREDACKKEGDKVKLLHNGLFTFEGADEKKYAFLSVTNLTKNAHISNAAYDIAPCFPIEASKGLVYEPNFFIESKQFKHNIPFHTSYDLDGIHKINTLEKINDETSENLNWTIKELESGFFLNKNCLKHFEKFQYHKTFELIKNSLGANGFYDASQNPLKITPQISMNTKNVINDIKEISSLKDFPTNYSIYKIETILRYIKLKPNGVNKFDFLKNENAKWLTESILLKETDGDGVFSDCFKFKDHKDDEDDDKFDDFEAKRPKFTFNKKNDQFLNKIEEYSMGSTQSVMRIKDRLKNK